MAQNLLQAMNITFKPPNFLENLGKLPDLPEYTPLPLVIHHLQSPRPQSPLTPSPSTPVSLGNINYITVRKQI